VFGASTAQKTETRQSAAFQKPSICHNRRFSDQSRTSTYVANVTLENHVFLNQFLRAQSKDNFFKALRSRPTRISEQLKIGLTNMRFQ
jgi:hypothetical protein